MLRWPAPAMYNLFCTQALNDVELSLVLTSGEPSVSKVISRADLSLADVSLVMDGGSEKDTLNVAFELDYQPLAGKAKGPATRPTTKSALVGFAYEE